MVLNILREETSETGLWPRRVKAGAMHVNLIRSPGESLVQFG